MKRLAFALLFVGLILAARVAPAGAAEAWCAANPSICVCSRTFQTAGTWITDSGLPTLYYQAEESPASNMCGVSDGGTRAWLSLISGGTPTQVASGIGTLSATQLPWTMTVGPPSAARGGLNGRRVGVRYYHWTSNDYVGTNTEVGGTCTNDKYTQMGDYLTYLNGRYNDSSLAGGAGFDGWTWANRRSRWMMIEHYIQVYSNAATTHEYYMTDVATGQSFSFSSASYLSGTTGEPQADTDVIHRYRAGAQCVGSYRVMFAAMASWPAGGSQRIPAATELTGSGPTTPTAPSALAVTTP